MSDTSGSRSVRLRGVRHLWVALGLVVSDTVALGPVSWCLTPLGRARFGYVVSDTTRHPSRRCEASGRRSGRSSPATVLCADERDRGHRWRHLRDGGGADVVPRRARGHPRRSRPRARPGGGRRGVGAVGAAQRGPDAPGSPHAAGRHPGARSRAARRRRPARRPRRAPLQRGRVPPRSVRARRGPTRRRPLHHGHGPPDDGRVGAGVAGRRAGRAHRAAGAPRSTRCWRVRRSRPASPTWPGSA